MCGIKKCKPFWTSQLCSDLGPQSWSKTWACYERDTLRCVVCIKQGNIGNIGEKGEYRVGYGNQTFVILHSIEELGVQRWMGSLAL